MRGHHVLHDGEPETSATGGPRTGWVYTVKTFEDPFKVPLRDPNALVGDAELNATVTWPLHADDDLGALRAVDDRVLQQVAQGGHQQVLGTEDGDAADSRRGERDTAGVRLHSAPVERLGDHRVDLHRTRIRDRLGRLDPVQRDQVLDEEGEPGRFL